MEMYADHGCIQHFLYNWLQMYIFAYCWIGCVCFCFLTYFTELCIFLFLGSLDDTMNRTWYEVLDFCCAVRMDLDSISIVGLCLTEKHVLSTEFILVVD